MVTKPYRCGYLCFALGLLFSSIASLLDRFVGAGCAWDFAQGALDGLSVVAFGVAIVTSVPAMRRGSEA